MTISVLIYAAFSVFTTSLMSLFKRKGSFIPFLLIALFFGIRVGVGTDYDGYLELYDRIYTHESYWYDYYKRELEPFMFYLVIVFSWLELPYEAFIFTMTMLIFFFIWRGTQEAKANSLYMMIFFISFGFVFSSNNIVRQSLAVAIVFYGYVKYSENSALKLIVAIFIATLVHYSAIITLSLVIIRRYPVLSIGFISIIMVMFNVLLPIVSNLDIFPARYGLYFNESQMVKNTGLGYRLFFELITISCIWICSLMRKGSHDKISKELFQYLTIFFIGIIMTNFLSGSGTLVRLSTYFYIFGAVVVGKVFLNRPYRGVSRFFFVTYAIGLTFRQITSDQYLPYCNLMFCM